MWHRYDSALRGAVVSALRMAGARGASAASVRDLAEAIARGQDAQAENSSQNDAVVVARAIDGDALAVIERAYELAALDGVKQISRAHVAAGLDGTRRTSESFAAKPQAAAATQDAVKDDAPISASDPRFATDPYPLYARWRGEPFVRRDPVLPVWVITGYDEVMAVLRDPRFTVRRKQSRTTGNTFSIDALPEGRVRGQLAVLANVLAHKMIFLDPPEHTRVRGLMKETFSPRACEAWRPRISRIADELLDAALTRNGRELDLIQDFALVLPIIVICEMIGLPPADRVQLKHWADLIGNVIVLGSTIRHEVDARRGMIEFRAYFDRVVARVRSDPAGDSLLAALVRNGYPSNDVEEAELFANVAFVLGAGHETTTSLIGNGTRILLNHRDQLEPLRNNPSLVGGAVEELLRFESPVQWTSRQALEDVEVGGVKIRGGESVLISLGAANRDARMFPDPDRLDIRRSNAARHLAFSGGIHFCLGAALSRVEGSVGLTKLIKRLPALRVLQDRPLQWKRGSTIRTLETLPAVF